jgi:PAS domain S-box-containing protein
MLLALTAFVAWEQVDSRRRLVRNTLSHAEMLADNCKASIAFEHKQDAEQILSTLRSQDSIVFACIYDKHGLVFAKYRCGGMTEKIRPPLPRKDSLAFENGYLSVFKQIVLDNEIIGTIYLRDDMRYLYSELKWDIAFAVVLLLLGLVMSYFLSSMFQEMISRPILNLAYVAQKVSKKNDYSVRALEESNDEMGYLTQVFNRMLEQIQQRDSALVEAKEILEKKVEERTAELTSASERMNFLLSTSPAVIYTCKCSGDYGATFISENVISQLGYRAEEFVQDSSFWVSHMHQEDRERIVDELPKIFESGSHSHEYRFLHKDGNYRWMRDDAKLVRDNKGQPTEIVGCWADITESKQAEEKLKQTAEEWITTFDSITDMVSIHDKDFKIVRANKAFANAFNMKSGEIIGKTCCELIHGTKEPPPFCPHKCTLDTGKPNRKEFFEPCLGIYIEASTSPLFDENGQIIASVHIAKDITERKQAEKEIQDIAKFPSENPNPVLRVQKGGKILYGNDAALPLLAKWKIKVGGVIPVKWRRLVDLTFESEKAISNEEEVDGSIFSFIIAPVADNDYANMYASDVTERKQAEVELKAAQEKLIETAHRAGMAEVAADVLHNVGNVLNSINVSTTVIREKVTNSEVLNLEKVASIINEHTDDLGTFLTEDPQGKYIPVYLTEVSKCLQSERTDIIGKLRGLADNVQHIKDIVSTQQSYAKVSGVNVQTSLSKLAEDALQINSAGLERHGTQLAREFEKLPDVEIDKQKVLQILVNLVSNAKYALSGCDKEEKLLTIRIYKHGEYRFRIAVADNGAGISGDNLAKIFSHGFTTKKHGHGFGLHSSALAAKEMGGSLGVHSDGVGKGATFTLELPFKPVGVVV